MYKQDWMIIEGGHDLVDVLTAARDANISRNARGFDSEQLCALQVREAGQGVLGVELVESAYGWTVRYDSGLQNWGLLASARSGQLDGSLDDARRYALAWLAEDPKNRYAWRRKTEAERVGA